MECRSLRSPRGGRFFAPLALAAALTFVALPLASPSFSWAQSRGDDSVPDLEAIEKAFVRLAERVQEATAIIQERGCLAEASQEGDDWVIKQFTCPFPNVAGENSCACSLDVEFVRQLVGADARLTTSLLRDDDACTFRIRPVEAPAGSKR